MRRSYRHGVPDTWVRPCVQNSCSTGLFDSSTSWPGLEIRLVLGSVSSALKTPTSTGHSARDVSLWILISETHSYAATLEPHQVNTIITALRRVTGEYIGFHFSAVTRDFFPFPRPSNRNADSAHEDKDNRPQYQTASSQQARRRWIRRVFNHALQHSSQLDAQASQPNQDGGLA